MSNRLVLVLMVMVLALAGLCACKPVCTPGELVAPQIVNPQSGSLYDYGSDSLEWSWPNQSCVPEGYLLEIVNTDEHSWEDPIHSVSLDGLTTSWNFDSPPTAATKYWWRVSAYADNVFGPTTPDKQNFLTGPICTGSSLIAPDPFTPYENSVVDNQSLVYTFSYSDLSCAPEGFELTVSRTEDLSDVLGTWDNFVILKRPEKWAVGSAPGITHMDCTEYFWSAKIVSGGMEGPPSPPWQFIVDILGNGCSCDPNAITMAILREPDDFAILPDTTAHLKWLNHGGCFPDGAAVQIATAPDFSNNIEISIAGQYVSEYVAQNLLPATQYHWKAGYYVDQPGGPVFGTYSQSRTFFTGPECTSIGEVAAPTRIAPADGMIVDTLTPMLQFVPGTPGCVPDGYLVHLHEMADFSDSNWMGETSTPNTSVQTKTLQDCTTYYWSVTAVEDGAYGPESDRGSFFVNESGSCSSSGMPASAKSNVFCREGTFPEHHDALWTFMEGQHALAIARNPFNTYLKLVVLDQETKQPLDEYITCWGLLTAFEPGWRPPDPPEGQYNFGDLPIEFPPATPVLGDECSTYTNEFDCMAVAGCNWYFVAGAPDYCAAE